MNMQPNPNPMREAKNQRVELTNGETHEFDRIIPKGNGWLSCWIEDGDDQRRVLIPPQKIVRAVEEYDRSGPEWTTGKELLDSKRATEAAE